MTLFFDQSFVSHSGVKLDWKIDCDMLQWSDWECIARQVARTRKFRDVYGVPQGGLLFAQALRKYRDSSASRTLIVDDVLTTGASMEKMRQKLCYLETDGVVLFARGKCPDWITPVFQLSI